MSQFSQDQQKVIEQIQKLLALSKSENKNEAALALARAESLLEKYRLDITQIEMMTGQKEAIIQDEDPLFDSPQIAEWESLLANGIAFLHGCTTIRIGEKIIKIIGRASDIFFVRYFIQYITLELFRISTKEFYKKRKDYKDAWFKGAVEVIYERMYQEKQKTQQKCTNQFAVVTINNRYQESQQKLQEFYPNSELIKYDPIKAKNEQAYRNGREAGKTIQLSHKEKINAKNNNFLL